MMRKIMVLFILTGLLYANGIAQCLPISDAFKICKLKEKKHDKYLKKRGFKLLDKNASYSSMFGLEWYNETSDTYFLIKQTTTGEFVKVEYRLKGEKECFESYKAEIDKYNFKKYSKSTSKYGTEYTNYTNENWAIIFVQFNAPSNVSGFYYQVHITTLSRFKVEISSQKEYEN